MKIIAGVASVTLVGAGVIGYKLTHKGPPSFRRGGQFAIAGAPATTAPSTPAASGETTSSTNAAPPTSADPAASSSTTATTARRPAPAASPTTATSGPRATPTTRAASGPAPAPTPSPTSPAKPAPAPSAPGKPAVGTYTFAVNGTEGASFVGSRKLPDKMTMVVHGGTDIKPDQLVYDLTYSDKHAEREIVGFRSDGISFDFEGGSVTFGPRTETSQADYEPPILEIPSTLQAGFSKSGTTKAKGADGNVSRTEDWTLTVAGQEPVDVGGTTVNAWKVEVDRKIRPGSADQGTRNRTMWFDPARNMWVKFVEVFHGERHVGIGSFTYDSNVTAVLASFTP